MFFVFLYCHCLSTFRPDHAVSLSVVVPWHGVPLFEQLLFYIADFSINSASTFLANILESNEQIDNSTFLWEKACNTINPYYVPLMKAQIENGFFLPRAEMFREIVREIGGSNYPDLLVTGSTANLSFSVDAEYPEHMSSYYMHDIVFGSEKPSCYIYANLHNKTVSQLILSLIQSEQSFILRPTAKTDKFGMNLRGFGIEMRPFKYSMEYGVKDSIVLDSASSQNSTFNDETVKNVKSIPPSYVPPESLESIGVKLSSYLRTHESESVPKLLRDITNNFPLFIPKIANSTQITQDVTAFNRVHHIQMPEESFSILNGRSVPLKNLDLFSLLDIITQESNFRTILESHFRMDSHIVRSISSSPLASSDEYILDYRSDVINYLNNIERDPEYRSWSTNINDLFNVFGGLPRVRKNLVNLIYICDVLSDTGKNVLVSLNYMIKNQMALRVGVVPHFNLANKLQRKVAFAFHHLSIRNQKSALRFLIDTFESVSDGKGIIEPSEYEYAYFYNKIVTDLNNKLYFDNKKNRLKSWNELHSLYDISSKEWQKINETSKYLQQIGTLKNVVIINGKVYGEEIMFTQDFLYAYQEALENVQTVIYQKKFEELPRSDIIDVLSAYSTVIYSLDTQVLHEVPQGFGLIHQSLSHQLSFAEYLNEIEWISSDKGMISSFMILFCPEGTDVSVFNEFMKMNHSVPTAFAINPSFPESIYKLDKTRVTLVSDGRIFHDFNPTDLNKYKMIDIWNKNQIYKTIQPHLKYIKYKRSEAILYLSCIITDWISESIFRKPINDHIWNVNSNLIYKSDLQGTINWDIVADPFTREFQRISDIIHYIDKNQIINVRLALVPPTDLTEQSQFTTISTYYRNALNSDSCTFTYLNDTTTYSSMPDMPNTWIFESMKADVDLDNILLKELTPSSHEGVYVLTNIMAEGYCYTNKGEFAEGAELALMDIYRNERKSDTIVMMSTGYWQLQANPGRFTIELGGKRSKMVYTMVRNELIVSSFASNRRRLMVTVNPGMEGLKVYNMSVTDMSNTTRVDVFSVASGHLYERLLKIMMLAVRRRSKYNVKFWIIKSFLSPQFKATLPIMAKKYNFSYQLVTYKWPTWLRPQYEKQRIIWGNKILFLDVLFPLDLERVIYVDSDQIVRTDLIELMRMDFGDAPYAFTPFCDSRKETEPFRFWKTGYWKELLGEKKYHISALFAIDLRRFRQMAAGDWLRYHYQQLSMDPASLANLDQDLPNYAQTHIPIYSLPQNWLWCETWCSDETIDKAKTIDLCNNPLTKKPKLYVAQTMVKEWPGLDEEVRSISAGPDDYQHYFFNNTI